MGNWLNVLIEDPDASCVQEVPLSALKDILIFPLSRQG